MMIARSILALCALGLAACSTPEPVGRNLPLDLPGPARLEQAAPDYSLADVRVTVPPELSVSESNGYYPIADIVWRGDPVGDRHAQIAEILETAALRAGEGLTGQRDVIAHIRLVRWHGVTERTRYSVGGVYHMVFDLTLHDPVSGAVVAPTRRLSESLPAPGGQAAVELERIGQTEKVRILDYLTFVLHRELTGAGPGEGWAPEQLVARAS